MTKTRPVRPHRSPVRRHRTRLIDLNGPKLYAMIVYRLAMTTLIVFALIEMGSTPS